MALWCQFSFCCANTCLCNAVFRCSLPQVAGLPAHFYSNVNKLDDQIRSTTPYGLFGIIRVNIRVIILLRFAQKEVNYPITETFHNMFICRVQMDCDVSSNDHFLLLRATTGEFVLLLKAILPCLMFVGSSVCILADETISTLGLLTYSFWSFRQCQMLFITRAYA